MVEETASVSVFTFGAWWDYLGVEMQAALVGAGATGLIGIFGFVMIVWQIREQARKSIKIEVYKSFTQTIEAATSSYHVFWSAVTEVQWDMDMHLRMLAGAVPWRPSAARVEVVSEKFYAMSSAVIDLMATVERWHIIDPRTDLFKVALSDALQEARVAWGEYHAFLARVLPRDDVVWHPPPVPLINDLLASGRRLDGKLQVIIGFLTDCQNEMQQLLLGGLFKRWLVVANQVKRREKVAAGVTVLRLDRYDELSQHFAQRSAERAR